MMSVCQVINEGLVKGANDIYAYQAMANYHKVNAKRYEIRSALLLSHVLCVQREFSEATVLLQRLNTSSEVPVS